MTTVAFDGDTLATDSRCVGDYIDDNVKKLFLVGETFYAVAGSLTEVLAFINWRESVHIDSEKTNEKPNIQSDISVIEVVGGDVFFWEKNCVHVPCSVPIAIGSGASFAMAAMLCGKTAIEAVEIAKKLDENSGGEVQFVRVSGH